MDVAEWLRRLGLEQYEPAFRTNEIDERVLPSLTAEDLKDLGVNLVGHRRRLLDAISALGAAVPAVAATAPPVRTDAERRQLTVMFCDLVGSTELSSRLDPEDLREVIAHITAPSLMSSELRWLRLRVHGRRVLIYFGYPQAQRTTPSAPCGQG
jgi:class 3 adenylate cyclase